MWAAAPQLTMFAQNICLLIFLLMVIGIAIFVIVAGWTGTKILLWRKDAQEAEQQKRRELLDADGSPLPPIGRGICEQCQAASDEIFHLPDGSRRCRRCWSRAPRP